MATDELKTTLPPIGACATCGKEIKYGEGYFVGRDEQRRHSVCGPEWVRSPQSTKLELIPASELSQIRPRPRPIDLRIGLAIHWALSKHDMPVSDADRKKLKLTVKGLAATFQRELGHVGLKLVWADGSTPFGVQE